MFFEPIWLQILAEQLVIAIVQSGAMIVSQTCRIYLTVQFDVSRRFVKLETERLHCSHFASILPLRISEIKRTAYIPTWGFTPLFDKKNDRAVATAYGLENILNDESAIAVALLKLYAAAAVR